MSSLLSRWQYPHIDSVTRLPWPISKLAMCALHALKAASTTRCDGIVHACSAVSLHSSTSPYLPHILVVQLLNGHLFQLQQ
jgi:hypothetical protein